MSKRYVMGCMDVIKWGVVGLHGWDEVKWVDRVGCTGWYVVGCMECVGTTFTSSKQKNNDNVIM